MGYGHMQSPKNSQSLVMYSLRAFQEAENRSGGPLPPPQTLLMASSLRWFFVLVRTLYWPLALYFSFVALWLWLYVSPLLRLFAYLFRLKRATAIILLMDQFRGWNLLRETYVAGALWLCSSPSFHWKGSELFWAGYYIVATRHTFHEDVNESLCRTSRMRLPPTATDIWSFSMYIDNHSKLEVPCAAELDDKEFMEHLQWLRRLLKIEKGFFGNLSLLSLGRIEIAKVGIWTSLYSRRPN